MRDSTTPEDASTPTLLRRFDLAGWKDADKVLLCSGLTLPFALGWVFRLHKVAADPAASPYISRSFLAINIPILWTQALGHLVLVVAALLARRSSAHRTPWLVHAEIQFWMVFSSISLYVVGAFTTPFSVLMLALPIIGYMLFEARPMNLGLVTMTLGSGAAIVLPQLGILPYAPFLDRAPFADGHLHSAWIAAFGVPSIFVSVVVLVIHTTLLRKLRARQAELEILSSTDVLTGLSNRTVFFRRLDEELSRARRHGLALCVVMLDADHFKQINDTFGHLVGDEVLRQLGGRIRASLRIDDVAARYGGEEFALLLPHTAIADAAIVGERLLVESRTIAFGDAAAPSHLGVSLGIAELRADDTADALVARADEALYEAKDRGRDRMVVSGTSAA